MAKSASTVRVGCWLLAVEGHDRLIAVSSTDNSRLTGDPSPSKFRPARWSSGPLRPGTGQAVSGNSDQILSAARKLMQRRIHWQYLVLCTTFLLAIAASMELLADETGDKAPSSDLTEKREMVRERFDVARRKLDQIQADGSQSTSATERAGREVELLTQHNSVLARQQSALDHANEISTALEKIQEQLTTLREDGPPEPRPYSFLLLERLQDELANGRSRLETQTASVADAKESLETAKAKADACHKERRRLREESEKGGRWGCAIRQPLQRSRM